MTSAAAPAQPDGKAYLRLVALGGLIGVPAAILAAGFLGLVHYLQHWLWTDLPDVLGYDAPPWFLVLGLPVAGAAVVLVARRLLPGDGGHEPLLGIGGGTTPVANAAGIALAALGTLGFGLVLGPEAPLIALGSAVGMAVLLFVRLDERESAVVSTAGSFSAVSALFGGPLVAGVLMLEGSIGLGASALSILVPGFVAAAVGYVTIVGFGSWGGLDVPGLAEPNLPVYEGTHVGDLFLAVLLGVVTALLIRVVRRLATDVSVRCPARLGLPGTLLAGGLAVGVLALAADALGADSQDVLFSGQSSIPNVVSEDSARVLLVLLAAKAIAYSVSLGAGFRGGPVFPAMFLGVALATFPVIWLDISPTWAVAAGAAAGMAAMVRMLLTPMLFSALLVGSAGPDAIPSAVLAAVAAYPDGRRARPRARAAVRALAGAALALRFALELCALAALAVWGFATGDGAAGWLLGIGAPVAAAVVWGTFAAPKARVPLPDPVRYGIGLAVFLVAALALGAAGRERLAWIYGVVGVADTAVVYALRRYSP